MPKISEKTPEVLYPEVTVRLCQGDDAITIDQAKRLLGWEEVEGEDYFTTDMNNKKIRCLHNEANRPYDRGRAEQYAQVILQRQWAGPKGNGKTVNGESLVIGKTGQTLSAQHRLTGLIFAHQRWEKEDHWRTNWPEAPVMESVVVYGVDESGETTMTIDNVKPRTAADVFYSDPLIYPKEKNKDRRELCKLLEFAIRFCWYRTGAKFDAYAPLLSHPEAKAFITAHPRILRAVKHVYQENADSRIRPLLSLGTAAGLMYLMAVSDSDPEKYTGEEKSLSLKLWDKATDFWTNLAKSVKKSECEKGFELIREAIAGTADMNGGTPPKEVSIGMLVKAWEIYSTGRPLTEHQLGYEYRKFKDVDSGLELEKLIQNGLKYEPEEPGDDVGTWLRERELVECPSVGGIDKGDPAEEIREEKERVREEQTEERRKLKEHEKAIKDAEKVAAPAKTRAEILAEMRKTHPVEVFVWAGTKEWGVYGNDALIVEKILGLEAKMTKDGSLKFVAIPVAELDAAMAKLKKAKKAVLVCDKLPDGSYGAVGTYLQGGGYQPLSKDDAPAPTPLPPVAGKVKAAPVKEEPVEEPAKPAAKPKGKTPPKLKGGLK